MKTILLSVEGMYLADYTYVSGAHWEPTETQPVYKWHATFFFFSNAAHVPLFECFLKNYYFNLQRVFTTVTFHKHCTKKE